MKAKSKAMKWVIIIAVVLIGIIGYRIYANLAANKERAARVTAGSATTVELGHVTRQDIRPVQTFSANLEPLWSADISSKVDGRIDRLYVDEGDYVSAGAVIATLDTAELAAQVAQSEGSKYSALANLEQAEMDLRRNSALAEQGAVSQQALDTARIKRDLAVGQLRTAEGALAQLRERLNNAQVEVPRNGIVTKRYLQSGYYAKTGSAIITLADTTSLLVKATIGEAQLMDVTVGSQAVVTINALGGQQFTGTVTRISPAATLPARSFTAEITVINPEGKLKPGMFAKADVPGQVHANALVVPEGALVLKEDQKTVFVVMPDHRVQQKLIKLGYVGGGWAEVLDGLQEGDMIVVAGHNKLKDGASVNVPAGEGEN
ncbi:MAG: efflux transporter, family, subunit [Firmicutes bacterium]|nr:efflux transporter, family, subunit [Bacillota bacterium]